MRVEAAIGELLTVHDVHFEGTAPSGRREDFHGVHLVFEATIPGTPSRGSPRTGGTTDAVAWVPLTTVEAGDLPVLDVVTEALRAVAQPRSRRG